MGLEGGAGGSCCNRQDNRNKRYIVDNVSEEMDSAQGCKQGVPKGDARRGCIQNDHPTFFNLFQMATPLFNLFKMATNKNSRNVDVTMTSG